jgi:hypothetical protein
MFWYLDSGFTFWFWKAITSGIVEFLLQPYDPGISDPKDPSFGNWLAFCLMSSFAFLFFGCLTLLTWGKPWEDRKALKKFADNNAKEIKRLEMELSHRKARANDYQSKAQEVQASGKVV